MTNNKHFVNINRSQQQQQQIQQGVTLLKRREGVLGCGSSEEDFDNMSVQYEHIRKRTSQ
jgi:hypothetical protein